MRPIFRDREDFSAGHSLTAQTIAALEASQFLVVICSPAAAQSAYVDEEVRYREALALGLDRGDVIVRRRLVQKMDLLDEEEPYARSDR